MAGRSQQLLQTQPRPPRTLSAPFASSYSKETQLPIGGDESKPGHQEFAEDKAAWLDQMGLHFDLASSSHNEMQQVLSVRAFHKLFFLSSIWHLAQLNLKVRRRAKGLYALGELNRPPLVAIWFGRKKAAIWNHLRNQVFLLADQCSSWKEGDDPIHRTGRNTLPICTSRTE